MCNFCAEKTWENFLIIPQSPACLDCENVRYGDMTVQDASVGFIFKGKANARATAELQSVIYMQWQETVVKWSSLNISSLVLVTTCVPMPDQLGHRPSHHKVEFFNFTTNIVPNKQFLERCLLVHPLGGYKFSPWCDVVVSAFTLKDTNVKRHLKNWILDLC